MSLANLLNNKITFLFWEFCFIHSSCLNKTYEYRMADLPIKEERIAKVMARAGLCSRRDAEKWIEQGRVEIDGKRINTPAIKVSEKSLIKVDGKRLPSKKPTRLWIMHKPKGCITSSRDPEGRQTIFDLLPKNMPRVITVGRLDYNSEGLLLLTNDGELARSMELPSAGWVRKYRARAYGAIDQARLDQVEAGVTIDGVKYAPAEIKIKSQKGDNIWFDISITEGKNREVRKILEYAGVEVNRLIRTHFGKYSLGDITICKVDEIEI